MTHYSQSCSCPPPPTFHLSLSPKPTLSPSFSLENGSNPTSIDRNSLDLDQHEPISPTNINFAIHQPQTASALTSFNHLQPKSISLSLSLSTPSLTRSNSSTSFTTVSTPTSSVFSSSTPSESKPSQSTESESSPVDLNQLNSLLYQLASPDSDSSSSNPKSSTPTSRAERRARFQSLLSTFHAATICKLDDSNSEELSSSLSELDSNYPVAPNSVLQGIASSMTEPQHRQQTSSSQPPLLPSLENPGALILASKIAAPFQDAVREATKLRKESGLSTPKLVGILATPSPPSVAYAEWTKKACQDVGIDFEIWKTWEDNEVKVKEGEENGEGKKDGHEDLDLEADVEDLIIAANADKSVHGIMVYYPIFGGRQDTYLQQIVDPRKDVEGLHFSFCWNMYHNVRWANVRQLGGAPGTTSEVVSSTTSSSSAEAEQPPPGFAKSILPCTPLAIVKCLESMGVYDRSLPYGDRLYGKTITIFNRSEVVGRPLAALLANDGARVFSVDLDGIQEFNKRAGLGLAGKITESTHQTSVEGGRSRSEIVKKAHATNAASRLRPHHVVRKSLLPNPQACVAESQVVISGVPSPNFKVPTDWIKPGTFTVNFSSEKNFEKDVRTKAGAHLGAIGKTTIAMLQRNLLRLVEYRELVEESS